MTRAIKHPDDDDKNVKRGRIASAEARAGDARRTERAMERLAPVDKPWEGWELRLAIAESGRSGDVVARLDRRRRGARGAFRLGPVDLEIARGDRVALVGPNGSGKTTLLQTMLGRLAPVGRRRRGSGRASWWASSTRPGRCSPPTARWSRSFPSVTGWTVSESRTLLAKFGLGANEVDRPLSSLSPGERTRAVLALLSARGVNTLVLDEPTNHLDLPAIEQLEQALGHLRRHAAPRHPRPPPARGGRAHPRSSTCSDGQVARAATQRVSTKRLWAARPKKPSAS